MVKPFQMSVTAIDPMSPSAVLRLNPWTLARLHRRWKRWEPWVLFHCRQNRLPIEPTLARAEESHRAFLLRCLAVGVNAHNLSDILERTKMDDPRVAPEERERRLQKHLNQRTRKLRREVRSWNNKGERWQRGERWPGFGRWARLRGRSCP